VVAQVSVRSGRIGADAAGTLVARIFILAAGLTTNIVVARTIGPEGKGLLSYLSYCLFLVISLGGIGLQTAAIHQLGKRTFSKETVAATQIILSAAAGLVSAIVIGLLLPSFHGKIVLPTRLLLTFLPIVFLSVVQLNVSGVMIGLGKIATQNRISMLGPAIWAGTSVIVLVILRRDATLAAYAWLLTQIAAPAVSVFWILRNAPPTLHAFGPCARASLRFGFDAYLANLLWALMLRIDGFLLGAMRGAERVGYYSVAVLLAEILWYFPSSLTLAMSRRVSADPQDEALSLTCRATRMGLWFVGIGSLLAAGLATPMIRLVYGERFLPAVRPLWILLPGITAIAIAKPLSLFYTQQKGSPRINAWLSGIAVLVNVGLNLLWIPDYGPSGAAAASTVAYVLVTLLLLWRIHKEPGFVWKNALLLRQDDVSAVVRTVVGLLPVAVRKGASR
jgi:O-antigen/teichoic acid export membrane protein